MRTYLACLVARAWLMNGMVVRAEEPNHRSYRNLPSCAGKTTIGEGPHRATAIICGSDENGHGGCCLSKLSSADFEHVPCLSGLPLAIQQTGFTRERSGCHSLAAYCYQCTSFCPLTPRGRSLSRGCTTMLSEPQFEFGAGTAQLSCFYVVLNFDRWQRSAETALHFKEMVCQPCIVLIVFLGLWT